jgi:glutamine synthetase
MLEMTSRDYIPAVNKYLGELSASVIAILSVVPSVNECSQKKHIEELSELLHETYEAYAALSVAEDKAVHMENAEEAAFFYKGEVAAAMDRLRQAVDGMEVLTAREHWPVPTYGDMTYRI